jgi:hypothetical protein
VGDTSTRESMSTRMATRISGATCSRANGRFGSGSWVLLLLLLPTFRVHPANGQTILPVPVSVEVRLGLGIPVGEFANREPGVEAEPGPMVGAGARVHLTPRVALLGGYSLTEFGCSRCARQGLDDGLRDEGADFALQVTFPVLSDRARPWFRGGGVFHQLTFTDGSESLSSDAAVGIQAGGGVSIALPFGLRLEPGLHFRSYSADLDLGGLPGETVDVRQLLLDLGISRRF